MDALIGQIESSLRSKHYFLPLFGALSVPDIAGALGSADGIATGAKYDAWFEQWVRPVHVRRTQMLSRQHGIPTSEIVNPLSGKACYLFRCSMLHQGRARHPKSSFTRIIFIEPGATSATVHYCVMNGALCIDLVLFCGEVIEGARNWLQHAKNSAEYKANFELFVQRHANGLALYFGGVPVIG